MLNLNLNNDANKHLTLCTLVPEGPGLSPVRMCRTGTQTRGKVMEVRSGGERS